MTLCTSLDFAPPVSYSEVQRFESCAAQQHGVDLSDLGDSSSPHFISDNVDHNLDTIDGLNTFHGMGTIACVTPPKVVDPKSLVIKRLTVSSKDVIEAGKIEIKFFSFQHDIGLAKTFEALPPLVSCDNTKVLGNLWQYAWLVKPMKPLWNGFMKSADNGSFPGKSAVHFLPMIDMKATDYSCIYSTKLFVLSQARKYSVDAILTFDQPLYWRAMEIKTHEELNNSFKDFVLILGPFHSSMSFYGSIGHLMVGSGLQSILELIYAEHTVPHMLSGKAYSRATRGHLITAGALSAILMLKIHDIEIDVDTDNDSFLNKFHNAMGENDFFLTLANLLDDVLAEKSNFW